LVGQIGDGGRRNCRYTQRGRPSPRRDHCRSRPGA
jgi:hypothetical protein